MNWCIASVWFNWWLSSEGVLGDVYTLLFTCMHKIKCSVANVDHEYISLTTKLHLTCSVSTNVIWIKRKTLMLTIVHCAGKVVAAVTSACIVVSCICIKTVALDFEHWLTSFLEVFCVLSGMKLVDWRRTFQLLLLTCDQTMKKKETVHVLYIWHCMVGVWFGETRKSMTDQLMICPVCEHGEEETLEDNVWDVSWGHLLLCWSMGSCWSSTICILCCTVAHFRIFDFKSVQFAPVVVCMLAGSCCLVADVCFS